MSEDEKEPEKKESEEEMIIPEGLEEQKPQEGNETEKFINDIVTYIENELPKNVNYVTGIIVDDNRNSIIIKQGRLYIGRSEDNCKPILEYMSNTNLAYLLNALYIMKGMLTSYKDMWSGKIENDAKKTFNDIL